MPKFSKSTYFLLRVVGFGGGEGTFLKLPDKVFGIRDIVDLW